MPVPLLAPGRPADTGEADTEEVAELGEQTGSLDSDGNVDPKPFEAFSPVLRDQGLSE